MIGGSAILFNPIVRRLSISPLFGLASPTRPTVLVIPEISIVLRDEGLLTLFSKET